MIEYGNLPTKKARSGYPPGAFLMAGPLAGKRASWRSFSSVCFQKEDGVARALSSEVGGCSIELLGRLLKNSRPGHQSVCFVRSSARCSSASRNLASPRSIFRIRRPISEVHSGLSSTGSRLLLSAVTSSSRSCPDKASASSRIFFAAEVTVTVYGTVTQTASSGCYSQLQASIEILRASLPLRSPQKSNRTGIAVRGATGDEMTP